MSKEKELANTIADYRVVDIDKIVPYWRNPYDNNDTAVSGVATSIEELTYFNPIIVDKQMTIICGHTRYKALKKLGVKRVVVMVSNLDELDAKSYRIADNKTTELSNWLIDRVRKEYIELPHSKTLETLFPTITMADPAELPKPLENASTQATGQENIDDVEIELICPNCMNGFTATWGEVKEMIRRGKEMGDGD